MAATQRLTPERILQMLRDHAPRLRELGAVRIGLFGSQVRGEARPGSDIDVLVTLAEPSYDMYCDVQFYLEDLFGRPVDLVLESGLKPYVRPAVLSEVIYAEGF